jgi:hypothetical protein
MATVYQCDRCSKQQDVRLYELQLDDTEYDNLAERLCDSQKPLHQSLCIDCTKDLGEWQRNPKKKYKVQLV